MIAARISPFVLVASDVRAFLSVKPKIRKTEKAKGQSISQSKIAVPKLLSKTKGQFVFLS